SICCGKLSCSWCHHGNTICRLQRGIVNRGHGCTLCSDRFIHPYRLTHVAALAALGNTLRCTAFVQLFGNRCFVSRLFLLLLNSWCTLFLLLLRTLWLGMRCLVFCLSNRGAALFAVIASALFVTATVVIT